MNLTEDAARHLEIKLQILEVRRPGDVAGAFDATKKEQADALNVFSSPFLTTLYREIIALAAEHRLPAIYQWSEHVEAGGLLSYGPSLAQMWWQAVFVVARIFRGAKPADLPIEQPSKFELVLNMGTAKSLLAVPQSLLSMTDEVIE